MLHSTDKPKAVRRWTTELGSFYFTHGGQSRTVKEMRKVTLIPSGSRFLNPYTIDILDGTISIVETMSRIVACMT